MTRAVGRLVAVVAGLAVLAAVALAVWAFTLGPDMHRYRAPSEAMVPTIPLDSRFMVNKDAYDSGEPKVGDIVVFHPPAGALGGAGQCGVQVPEGELCPRPTPRPAEDVTFVKRVVAGPGDRVAIRDGKVVLNGEPQAEPYVNPCAGDVFCDFPKAITVPDGHFFGMGDNRGASDDSRFWGPVPLKWLVGRVEDCTLFVLGCSPKR